MTSASPPYRNTAARFTFINQSLKGLGQIMLQDNSLTGLLFLMGIFIGSVDMGIAVIISVCVATIAVRLFKFETSNINQGLYGFNAALIGVAIILFCKPTLFIWCCIFIGAILSALLQHLFIIKKITVFTLPFVLVTWAILFFIHHFLPELTIVPSSANAFHKIDFGFAFRGYGQVIFQDHLLAGVLFFIAVFINKPVAALYGLAGSVIAVFVSQPFSVPLENVNLGLVSYNAVLCAIVFAGGKTQDVIWVLFSVVLATVISQLMTTLPFPQLTFPFVAASVATLFLKNNFKWIGNKAK